MGRPIKKKWFSAKFGSIAGNLQVTTSEGDEVIIKQAGTSSYYVDSGRVRLVDSAPEEGEATLQHDGRYVKKLNQYRVYYFDLENQPGDAVWRDGDGNVVGSFTPTLLPEDPDEPGGPDKATATATATVADGEVSDITVVHGGKGYTSAPGVTISAPNGTDAVLGDVTTVGDAVTDIEVTNGGSGYSSVPEVTITGDGTGATAEAVLTDGVVTSINITDGGADYTGTPTATIDAVTKTQATATAVLDGDKVGSVTVDEAGAGYVSATVTIDPA